MLKPYKDKKAILEFLVNELVDDLYKKVKGRGYEFKTVGIKLVRTNFGLETRETTFSTYRADKESIASVMESLLEKFQLDEINNPDNLFSTVGFSSIRKLGIKASNLSKIDKKKLPLQKTLFDYM